ncbi:MAG: hypothetical protein IKV01_04835 [Clostridia bacterium]|nr:hypothetical protein [Clostridia bacterium]
MKRSIVFSLVFLLTAVIVLSSCEPENGASVSENIFSEVSNEEVSNEIKDDASVDVSDIIMNSQSPITVSQRRSEEILFTLSGEDLDFVKELWRGEWYPAIAECDCDYEFKLDGMIIEYSDECGLFNDYPNQRSMTLTEEQTQAVNKMLGIE